MEYLPLTHRLEEAHADRQRADRQRADRWKANALSEAAAMLPPSSEAAASTPSETPSTTPASTTQDQVPK